MVLPTDNKEKIRSIILVGAKDIGRCPVASRISRALWPIAGIPVITRLLEHLYRHGINRVTICCEEDSQGIRSALVFPCGMEVTILEDQLPRGTAGCLRDAVDPSCDDLVLVFPAAMAILPDISALIEAHHRRNADMTVFFNPTPPDESAEAEPAQIYACKPSIVPFIPEQGYCDLKENLVSRLVKAGLAIRMEPLSRPVGNFRHWADYLDAIPSLLAVLQQGQYRMTDHTTGGQKDVWVGPQVQIHPSAKVIGPVVLEKGCRIQEEALIIGPSILEEQVTVGPGASVIKSVVWPKTTLGRGSHIHQCLVEGSQTIPAHAVAYRRPLIRATGFWGSLWRTAEAWVGKCCPSLLWRHLKEQSCSVVAGGYNPCCSLLSSIVYGMVGIFLLSSAFLWAFWSPTLTDLWRLWRLSDEYSSGMLVLPITVYVLWIRRHELARYRIRPSLGWGILLLFGAQAFRFLGLFLMFDSAERLALIGTIYALVVFLFGWHVVWKNKGLLLFLLFMIPFPNRIQARAAQPLQTWATVSAVFSLETLGYDVKRDGNVINVNGTQVAVAEACNGLRMLTAFFVISGLVALVVHRAWWEKAVLMASSVPIALLCNTLRLVGTSIAFTMINQQEWEEIFHDFGGLAMMPVALGILVGELWLLAHLVVGEPQTIPEQVVYRQRQMGTE
ncbi:MAG: exosortase [Sedimentisphaerales bacterium]|nr:exosortase [Sedimentisphaerales bacterium]